jgi:hypothetical protein
MILTSNLPFARWGDVFGDQVVAAAMIDRIVHHADVLTLKGSNYRLKDTGMDCPPHAKTTRHNNHDHVAYASTVVNTRARGDTAGGSAAAEGTDIDNPSPGRGTL